MSRAAEEERGYGCTNGGILFTDGTTDAAICHGADGADGACGLTDGSSAGDWRLPTTAEWAATTLETTPTSGGEAIVNFAATSAGSKAFVLSVWPVPKSPR